MSITKGYASLDPDVFKRAWTISKGKDMLNYRLVGHILVRTDDNKFILEDINKAEVRKKILLRRNNSDFLTLNEKFICYIMPFKD